MKLLTTMFRRFPNYKYSSQFYVKNTVPLNHHKTLVINQNLKFDAKELDLYVIPSHPRIIAKGMNSIQIDPFVPVLELAFVKKPADQNSFGSLWGQRIVFQLSFNQLHSLLDLEIDSGCSKTIQSQKEGNRIIYDFTDVKQKKEIKFGYRESKEGAYTAQTTFLASLQYSEFELLQDIVKECLYDLSGLRFIFEKRREDEIAAVRKEIISLKLKEEQVKSFYSV